MLNIMCGQYIKSCDFVKNILVNFTRQIICYDKARTCENIKIDNI